MTKLELQVLLTLNSGDCKSLSPWRKHGMIENIMKDKITMKSLCIINLYTLKNKTKESVLPDWTYSKLDAHTSCFHCDIFRHAYNVL
jgi:hypothetical protein